MCRTREIVAAIAWACFVAAGACDATTGGRPEYLLYGTSVGGSRWPSPPSRPTRRQVRCHAVSCLLERRQEVAPGPLPRKRRFTPPAGATSRPCRLGAGALFVPSPWAGLRGWMRSRSDHPRATAPAFGKRAQVVEVPPESVYAFTFYGSSSSSSAGRERRRNRPTRATSHALSALPDTRLSIFLAARLEQRRSTGELRQRVRALRDPSRASRRPDRACVRGVSDLATVSSHTGRDGRRVTTAPNRSSAPLVRYH